MTILLIRHTSVIVPPGLCYGQTDVPLSPSFEDEAASVRNSLPPGPWAVWSSPSTRCLRLAKTLATDVQIDERLRELDFGVWDGRPWSELPRDVTDLWLADFLNSRPPDGETFAELATRAEAFLCDISHVPMQGTAVVVTHAGVIRALLARAAGTLLHEAFSIPVAFGSTHTLRLPPTPLDDFASVRLPRSIFP